MKCMKVWFQLGTKSVCLLNAFTQSWCTLRLRKEGSYFENKVLMKLRLKKKKVMIRNYTVVAILLIAVNIEMNSDHLPHKSSVKILCSKTCLMRYANMHKRKENVI